jgi:hypothetical protein
MYRTHSIRIMSTSTTDSPRQRRIKDANKAFASTMGKEDILQVTVIRKKTIIVSLEEGTIQELDILNEEH